MYGSDEVWKQPCSGSSRMQDHRDLNPKHGSAWSMLKLESGKRWSLLASLKLKRAGIELKKARLWCRNTLNCSNPKQVVQRLSSSPCVLVVFSSPHTATYCIRLYPTYASVPRPQNGSSGTVRSDPALIL